MIKKFIVGKCLRVVSDVYPEYDDIKIDEIRYGLESIYLSLTKTIIILLIAYLIGIFKESVMLLLFFNGLRLTGFGIHASKSWMCWVSSSISFLLLPFMCKYLQIPNIFHYIVLGLSIICFILYAPADTKKRPLIHKNKRLKFKVLTVVISVIYLILFIYTDSNLIKNLITTSMIIESVLIHPLTYRIFKLPYRNYEGYVFSK